MAIEIKVPDFPESVSEGTIVSWHKQPGDAVKRDEILVDVETDKVVFELPAPQDGVLQEILGEEGATVVAGQVIARLGEAERGEIRKPGPVANAAASATAVKEATSVAAPESQGAAIVMPAARKLAATHGLDSNQITGTGRGGRILKEDVLKVVEATPPVQAREKTAPATAPATAAVPKAVEMLAIPSGERPEKRVTMTRLRARIAERLVAAQQSAAILSTFNEVNMRSVMDLRQRYREQFEKEYGARLGFMSFFVKASVEALKRFPELNASIDGNDIVYHGFYDIGIAVSSPRGLVVPILRDADRISMAEIESRIAGLAQKAQDGKLTMEDITGGTFTVTNGGVFGSMLSTPIINPPQSGILGMHKIQQRPVVENGEIVIRPMMYLALSYDHRIIDGREAVQFLVMLKELLEDPARMLLEV